MWRDIHRNVTLDIFAQSLPESPPRTPKEQYHPSIMEFVPYGADCTHKWKGLVVSLGSVWRKSAPFLFTYCGADIAIKKGYYAKNIKRTVLYSIKK